MNNIIFGGDSFTWGEGLELYQDTPKWIEQRKKDSQFPNYYHLIDDVDTKFRETHNFAGRVAAHFGYDIIQMEANGYDFTMSTDFVNSKITPDTKTIVYQISQCHRFYTHYDKNCQCDFCMKADYDKPWHVYFTYLEKLIEKKTPTEHESYFYEYMVNVLGFPTFDEIFDKYDTRPFWNHDVIDTKTEKWIYNAFEWLFNEHILKWKEKYKVILIDSWDDRTSTMLSKLPYTNDMLLAMKGYDGNYYKNWKEWENTFPHTRIQSEFPKTNNGHPTFLQHQYLAESIIENINNRNII